MGSRGGKGGGGSSAKIPQYFMSMHCGLCIGPVDEITQIILGDKTIWQGSVTQSRVFNINSPEIFGGNEREGGAVGGVTFLMGEDHQRLPDFLRNRIGTGVQNLVPGYRNMTGLFFHEPVSTVFDGALLADLMDLNENEVLGGLETAGAGSSFGPGYVRKGFYWQANNPYLKKLSVTVNRQAMGLDRRHATIWRDAAETVADANPAHIIYELQTNRDFGAGLPISRIDVESYAIAARTLHEEGFGLSVKWIRQGKVKDLILEMLDHINAVCYEHPRTGLSTLRLLRNDYDLDSVPLLDTSNSRVTDFQRKHSELINEVVVTFTDGQTYEEASVTVQDIAGIAIEGGTVSTSRNYYAVHKPALARQLGERDLRAEGYPLATAEAEMFRQFWDLVPGDVVKLNSPEDNETTIVMRVLNIEDKVDRTGAVKATMIEDVFSLEAAPFLQTPTSIIEYTDEVAEPVDYVKALTMPYAFAVQFGLYEATDDDYPIAYLGIMAATDQSGVDEYDIATNVTSPFGAVTFESVQTATVVPRGLLAGSLSAESTSIAPLLTDLTNGDQPIVNDYLLIGDRGEEGDELAGITASDNTGITLLRGILDTTPKFWPAGTPVWVIDRNALFWDFTQRSASETTEYKILPFTSAGKLDVETALLREFTLGERPYLPYRPANVQADGIGFGTYNLPPARANVTVTWSNRRRQFEDVSILPWDAASVQPENGQTIEIDVTDTDGNVLESYTGITGETYDIPSAVLKRERVTVIRVYARRDGYRSLQGHEIRVSSQRGYGYAWGLNYGQD